MADPTRRPPRQAGTSSRSEQLLALLRLPELPGGAAATGSGAPVEALLTRVTAFTGALREHSSEPVWDMADALAARLILSDLALLNAHLRALARETRERLVQGLADLEACRKTLQQHDEGTRDA